MKLTLERQIPLAFIVALLLLVLLAFFAYRSINTLSDAVKWEKHTLEVLLKMDETTDLMLNAETSVRGFMLTKDESFLEPFNLASQKINQNLAELQDLSSDNPSQTEKIASIKSLADEKFALLQTYVEKRRSQSWEQILNQQQTLRGKQLMDNIRQQINEMKQTERHLLEEREKGLEKSVAGAYRMIVLGSFAGIISLALANLAIFREISKRRQTEKKLKNSYSELENRVTDRTAALAQINEDLKSEIIKREQFEKERETLLESEQIARRDAEIANRLRDEFLATVSHELRAPLNSILGWSRLMQQGRLDEKSSAKAVETVIRNAEAQNRLIEDLLDVSRIISGKLRLEIITVNPANIVESALETVRPAAEAKNILLEIKEDSEISHISGDPNRLQQVVWNLLSNAIKFTPNDGSVRVEILRGDPFVEIRVIDSGVGINKDFLPHVFDRFRQADASSIRKFGGLGLGLAIVRHLTEMHGGSVEVRSEGENKGAMFIVRLPLLPSQSENSEFDEFNSAKLLESRDRLRLDGLLILAIDDEEDARQLLVQSLTYHGATVITASSARQGFTEFKDKNPDVVVSDIGMPEEDGYSLINKIRAINATVPAVALTAFARAQDRVKTLSAGFQTHVAKPVEPDELVTVIASLTNRLEVNNSTVNEELNS